MKRLFTCILLCAISTICFGQLTITSSYDGSKTQSEKLNINDCFIKYNPQGGFFITSSTSNRYDGVAVFELGNNKEEALATLNDIIKIFDTQKKGYSVEVVMKGTKHFLFLDKQMGKYCLWIETSKCAGRWWLVKKNVEKAKEWVEDNF